MQRDFWYQWYDWYQWNYTLSIGVPLFCICVCLGWHVCMDIAFSVCLGSHALRTKNIHCICDCLGSHASIFIVCKTLY